MAYIRRPSPFGELAKVLGGVADDIQRYRDTEQLATAYEPYFDSRKQARSAARNPQVASGLFKMKAAQAKQQKAVTDKEDALNKLEAAKKAISTKKQLGMIGDLKQWFAGSSPERDEAKTLYESLKKNPVIKEMGIPLPAAKDDLDVQLAFIDQAMSKLGGSEQKEEEQPITEGQRQNAEEELDVQDVASEALGTEGPVDDAENDEYMDEAAVQMNQEMGSPEAQQGMQQNMRQQMGSRTAPGQQQQGTSLQGLPGEIAEVGRSLPAAVASGAGGVVRSLAEIPSAIKSGVQGIGESLSQQLPPNAQEQFRRSQEFAQQGPQYEDIIKNIPSRQEIYKKLGGKEASTEFGKALLEFSGDVPEQLALGMVMGGVGPMQQALKAAGMVQGAGNFAKFMAKTVGGASEDTANSFKLGASLLTAYNMGPKLQKAAGDMYAAAESELPDTLRIKDPNRVGEVAFRIRNNIANTTTGFQGDPNVFSPMINGGATYKDALRAIKEINTEGNVSKALKQEADVLRGYLMKDMRANRDVPKEAIKLFDKAADMWKNLKNANNAIDEIGTNATVRKFISEGGFNGLVNLGLIGAFSYPRTRKMAVASVGLGGLWSLGRVSQMMMTSPAMRQYYSNLMTEAVKQNAPGIVREAKKLNAVIEKQLK